MFGNLFCYVKSYVKLCKELQVKSTVSEIRNILLIIGFSVAFDNARIKLPNLPITIFKPQFRSIGFFMKILIYTMSIILHIVRRISSPIHLNYANRGESAIFGMELGNSI